MKILHIISDLDAGGASAVLAELILSDKQNKHVVVSMLDKGAFGQSLIDAGVQLTPLGMRRGFLSVKGLYGMYKCLRAEKPDVVQTWMYHSDLFGGLVARMAGIKAICWGIHNSNLTPARTSRRSRIVAKICASVAAWLPKKIISCSSYAALIHKNIGYDDKKIIVVYNGYDLSRFRPIEGSGRFLRSLLPCDENCRLIGMIARWHPVKDHKNLLAAMSQLRVAEQWRLVLVGTGMSRDNSELVELLKLYDLDTRVALLGERDDIPELLSAMDLHVLSSAGEAFPNAVAEAMACGTPCVVTDVGDAAFIVDGAGLVVPPSDSIALRQAIEVMLSESKTGGSKEIQQQRQQMLHKKIADRFSAVTMVEGYNAVWRSAVGKA